MTTIYIKIDTFEASTYSADSWKVIQILKTFSHSVCFFQNKNRKQLFFFFSSSASIINTWVLYEK